jgi:TPR repeat protein
MKWHLISALSLVASAAALASPPKTVRDGIEAWQHANYAEAVAIWKPLADKGNADAAFNLGQAYRLGRGVAVDLATAQQWLARAATAGHLDAQTTLGLLLFDSGSRDVAMQWLKKAAQRGEPRAMLVYGTALFNGDSVPKDPVMAYAYVSRAAAQGLGPAKDTLAQMDEVLPVEVRQKGVAIARGKARAAPAPASKLAKVTAKPKPPAANVAAKPKSSPANPVASSVSGSWRIQLGAFSKKSAAEALYRKLSGSAPIAGHSPVYFPVGAITRLQVGGFASRSAAAAACASLSAKGQACFPVEGK